MNVLVSGSSGLVGSALVSLLRRDNRHTVIRLVRWKDRPKELPTGEGWHYWDPNAGLLEKNGIHNLDAVIHLAGENIAKRWTAEQKAKIRDSRVKGTRLLSETLAQLARPPKVLVCASAIGYYGDRGEELLNEQSPPGTGFLAEVCQEWETASETAARKGIRVVSVRIGVVLAASGGALAKMLPVFRLGLGGKIGSGRQYMSWIALDDLIAAIHHAMITETLRGAVNAVAPNPVRNVEFAKTLGQILGRPTIFPMPGFAARLAFGEMADELLLASTRVDSARLQSSGYTFRYSLLKEALPAILRPKT